MAAISMAGLEKKWLKSLRVISNVNVFATQDRSAGRTNTTYFIDRYDSHMDQKRCNHKDTSER